MITYLLTGKTPDIFGFLGVVLLWSVIILCIWAYLKNFFHFLKIIDGELEERTKPSDFIGIVIGLFFVPLGIINGINLMIDASEKKRLAAEAKEKEESVADVDRNS